jgi:hypothetical protein
MAKNKIKLKVFIGYDEREDLNAKICLYSIKKHCTIPIEVNFLKQDILRDKGLYKRPVDVNASNQFSMTRFLTPYLAQKGFALFMDCDMLVTQCFSNLLSKCKGDYSLWCVKHDYIPKELVKMDGQKQFTYPRKNWSSFVVYNASDPLSKEITPELVNKAEPAFLHRFEHFPDDKIGALPIDWNFLAGEYPKYEAGLPANIHHTLGSPMFPGYEQCDYSEVWFQYKQEMTDNPKFENSLVKEVRLKDTIIWANERSKAKEESCGC